MVSFFNIIIIIVVIYKLFIKIKQQGTRVYAR